MILSSSVCDGGLQPVPAPPAADGIFFDDRERAIVLDSLRALEEQVYGGAMMPPRLEDEIQARIVAVSIRVGSSPVQLVNHWLYWAMSGGR